MRMIVIALLLVASNSWASYSVKLDLIGSGVEAIGVRDLNGGGWLAGASKQVLSIHRDGNEKLCLNMFSAWDANGGNPAYGPSLGIPLGRLGDKLNEIIVAIAPGLAQEFGWLHKIGNFASLDVYGGYRVHPTGDSRPWVYGFGGKLKIPLNLIGGL